MSKLLKRSKKKSSKNSETLKRMLYKSEKIDQGHDDFLEKER